MHEISLVRSIFRTLEEEFPNDIERLCSICLTVGELSNVQPILIQNAFQAVVADIPRYRHVQLKVEWLPILIYCQTCDKTSEVHNYRFVCSCGEPSRQVVQGEELTISSVEFSEVIAAPGSY